MHDRLDHGVAEQPALGMDDGIVQPPPLGGEKRTRTS